MLDELRELYQEVILDHGRNPRNLRQPADANRKATGNNPLCGNILTVYLSEDKDGVVTDAAFVGKGCAISMASASLMTEILKGKTVGEAERLFDAFHRMCTKHDFDLDREQGADGDALERLSVLAGVREFPIRGQVRDPRLAHHDRRHVGQ